MAQSQSLRDFQETIRDIYTLPDDRLYSIFDLLAQMQRFTMRALKGVRQQSIRRVKTNLLIAFAWLMAIANRLHVDVEDELWKRFPARCSYCGKAPCICKKIKLEHRAKVRVGNTLRPKTLAAFQELFRTIYPSESRTLADASIHLAEETGEVSEAIHNFLGQHYGKQFDEVRIEIADYASCIFGVANSADIELGPALEVLFKNGCHICHKRPCACTFTAVAALKS